MSSEGGADAPPFVPAIVAAGDQSAALAPRIEARIEPPELPSPRRHAIELDIEGTSVCIWREADVAMVTAIISALKAGK
jgi:hypothetical protein